MRFTCRRFRIPFLLFISVILYSIYRLCSHTFPKQHTFNIHSLSPIYFTHDLSTNHVYSVRSHLHSKYQPNFSQSDNVTILLFAVTGGYKKISTLLDHLLVAYRVAWINHLNIQSMLHVLYPFVNQRLIIFEEFYSYTSLSPSVKNGIDEYCRMHGVGVIGFLNDGRAFTLEPDSVTRLDDLPIYLHRLKEAPWGFFVAKESTVLRILRQGVFQPGLLNYDILFNVWSTREKRSNYPVCCLATLVPKPGYEHFYNPVAFTRTSQQSSYLNSDDIRGRTCHNRQADRDIYQSLVLEDVGSADGVRRILFASQPAGLWSLPVLLMDAISYLSNGALHTSVPAGQPFDSKTEGLMYQMSHGKEIGHSLDLARWLMVDIDDVFSGTFAVEDAQALKLAQHKWRKLVPGFTFNLGYSGRYYERKKHNLPGFAALMADRKHYWWFDHMWNHESAISHDKQTLIESMKRNRKFAQDHDILLDTMYSVSPFHAGVYPVYPDLYEAWRELGDINITSTIHYYKNVKTTMGFQYNGVQVLPRQTCSIFSNHLTIADYPGGYERLRTISQGGRLFYDILFNPVSIFMTHIPNHKGDRLAMQAFDSVFNFIAHWTNLRMYTARPVQLAELFRHRFQSFGSRKLPMYSDPCSMKDADVLWPKSWPCGTDHLPNVVILGPQKTGSTALYHFLSAHPDIRVSNFQNSTTYEELQFFSSDRIYSKGVHWYMNQFPSTRDTILRMEKSATYFISAQAVDRLASLLPNSKLIVLLMHPVDRAYSFYIHQRFHSNLAAQVVSFSTLMDSGSNISIADMPKLVPADVQYRLKLDLKNVTNNHILVNEIRKLYRRCVNDGHYEKILQRWLERFSPSKIFPIDATRFRKNPIRTLNSIQEFLKVTTKVDYANLLYFDSSKGFYCLKPSAYSQKSDRFRLCLGPNKGRSYPALDRNLQVPQMMRDHFMDSNEKLMTLFGKFPIWRYWLSRSGAEYPDWLTSSN